MRQFFHKLSQNFQFRFLLRPRTGRKVLLQETLQSSPLFQRKPRFYVEYAVPLVILDFIAMSGNSELVWNRWTREVEVVDEELSTKDKTIMKTEREPFPIPFRLAFALGHTLFGTLIAMHLLRARFRSIRTLAFVPPKQGSRLPPSIVVQCAYHPKAIGVAFPVKDCMLQDLGTPGRLEILVKGETDGWWMDINQGGLYNCKSVPQDSLRAGIIKAWVDLKAGKFRGPVTDEELKTAVEIYTEQKNKAKHQ